MKKKIGIFSILAALAFGGFLFAQSSQFEVTDPIMLFRATNPVIAFNGTLSWKNVQGTVLETFNSTTGGHSMLKPASVGIAGATLTVANCGGVVVGNDTVAEAQAFILPAVSLAGCEITFLAGHATSEITVNAAEAATDCVFTSFAAIGADADTGIITLANCGSTGLKNTNGTNAIGDSLTLVSDGTRWLGVGIGSGIWASQ